MSAIYTVPQAAAPTSAGKLREMSGLVRLSVIVLPVGTLIVLNLFSPLELENRLRIAASVTWLLAWIPYVLHVITNRHGIPFMPVFGLIYGIYFAGVLFLTDDVHMPQLRLTLSDETLLRAELLSMLGLIAVLMGYYLIPEKALAGLPRVRLPLEVSIGRRAAVIIGVLGLLSVALQQSVVIPIRLQAVFTLLGQMLGFCIGLLFYYQLRGEVPTRFNVFLWGFLLPARLLLSLTTGAMAQVITDFLVLMGTYWVVRHKWPWKTALLLVFLLIPFLGVKQQYRQVVWYTEASGAGYFEKAGMFVDIVTSGFQENPDFYWEAYMTVVKRSDMITTFAAIAHLTPDVVPYWEGESYVTLLWMFVPRLIYPDKPLKITGQDFGHRYGLLGKADRSTSYNLPQVVEMYANFGPMGVFVGMLFIGVLCRCLYYLFTHPLAGEGGLLFGVIIFTRLCNLESDFSMVYGGLFLNIVSFYFVVKMLTLRALRLPMDALGWR